MAQKKFVCSVCGYVHYGDAAPEVCPQCKQSGVFVEEKKKGIDTNSNTYTIVYSTILVVIVAVLLALVSQVLSPRQEANILLDKQKQILGALKVQGDKVQGTKADPAALYLSIVNDTLCYGDKEVYVANLNGETKYILPLSGKGLWGGIGGYLALDADKNTIYGVNFNHESETPGLGAKIVELPFREQFEGKHIRNAEGAVVSVAVLKAGKHADGQEQVDAISGATITSSGVSTMLEVNLEEYKEFLNLTPTLSQGEGEDSQDSPDSPDSPDTQNSLPAFVKGESGPHEPLLKEKTTTPPKYYTEATLLRAMETAGKTVENDELREAMKENGIGRPSTRAAIIEKLYQRKYIEKQGSKSIRATAVGIDLIHTIISPLLKSAELTGLWEKKLREIERGEYTAQQFLAELKEMTSGVVRDVKTNKAGMLCPVCRQGLIIRGNTRYGCSRWREGCSYAEPFDN